MLKALELVGFKSFADKTRFEFSRGITAVVGPNGSGKSNVVDAIKWVLGEQSPKSLRGKEMADVIFNGSGSRKPVNMAEVTLTFDNSKRLLPLEGDEVHISRRVYRSGESEYLINRQPSRLRDIRDLFMGTGAATEAYSVIEQGKVDALLQSSAKDRREIFEEAAGISRFKAKKLESLRRLERVDQNLLRLADIVEEVHNQLKAVRAQAGKAAKYKEYSERLQSLRTQVGMADWRKISEQLVALESDLEARRHEIEAARAQVAELEEVSRAAEARLAEASERFNQAQRQLNEIRNKITSAEATIDLQRARCHDIEDELGRHRRQLATLVAQTGELRHQLAQLQRTVEQAKVEHASAAERLARDEESLVALQSQIDAARQTRDKRQIQLREELRSVAMLGGEISSLQSQVESALANRRRIQQRLTDLESAAADLDAQLEQLRVTELQLVDNVQQENERLADAQQKLAERREKRAAVVAELNALSGRHAGTSQRIALLEDLEKRQEGVSAGVKQVLAYAREATAGPFAEVRGLVADLLQVSLDTASLIEVALGESAQHVVVSNSTDLFDHLRREPGVLSGRVAFLPLDRPPPPAANNSNLEGERGVIGRADHFVETTLEFRGLAERLLGRTWIVETLAHAIAIAEGKGRGQSFVTLAGESIAVDGTLAVGPRHATLGLISRRSQLRELRSQLEELQTQIDQHSQQVARLDKQVEQDDRRVQEQTEVRQAALDTLATHRQRKGALEGRLGQLAEQRSNLAFEMDATEQQHKQASSSLARALDQVTVAEARVSASEDAITAIQVEIDHHESQRAASAGELTAAKIQLAKSEERLAGLQSRLEQLDREQRERRRNLSETEQQIAACDARRGQAEITILRHESETALWYLTKEALSSEVRALAAERDGLLKQRTALTQQAETVRHQARYLEEKLHARELEITDLKHKRTTLVDRLRDDYGIDLATLEHAPTEAEQHEREAAEKEIEDLRRKLGSLGHVNLDALSELNELESRFTTLSSQHDDLTQAKSQLEQIIHKINADSRRLFSETLTAIRAHFQVLFRKLFGGGHADIVLEEGGDVLDCGVEIIARPPGKEPRSISLLSGGEKTMTCVGLLFAIFKNRPSPFCVLDEVDAALDEANNERLNAVLQEFLTLTQFIVVTHSKKTMTGANTLYGVTMQESGISKRVSVRFEDVREDGQIQIPPDAKAADGDDAEEAA